MTLKIGQILIQAKHISNEQLTHCLEHKRLNPHLHLGSIMRHHGYIQDRDLADGLSKQINWQRFEGEYIPDQTLIAQIGLDYLIKYQIYPLKNVRTPSFVIAYIDNTRVTDFISQKFPDTNVHFYIGSEGAIRDALDVLVTESRREKLTQEIADYSNQGSDALASLFGAMMDMAIIMRASDIHIEPTPYTADIRFRIDGVLAPFYSLKAEYILKMANIILTKCKGNPCDYGIQDGRFEHVSGQIGHRMDVRFSQIPTLHGPSIVLRLLDQGRSAIALQELGLNPHPLKLINQAIKIPHGLVLVTGPTGSGKSTSVSAILNKVKSISKKIITIEDPVEITHALISQVEIKEEQELDFATAVRAFLRHDPNMILIGEIRDRQTALEAIRAANTGLQVFATLHTHDPVAAILRLQDLGVDRVNIASCLTAVMSQRLVRTLCPFCKKTYKVQKTELQLIEEKYVTDNKQILYVPDGCTQCFQGYLGRTVIAEVLLIDEEIKMLIAQESLGAIYSLLAKRSSHQTLIDDARLLIKQGITSIEEMIRVLG